MTDSEKFESFRRLHDSGEMLLMPNPWDIGSTRIFSRCGFKALATTSGGMAYALGKRDGVVVTREEALKHCRDLASATDLPVSADLENGYGATPEAVASILLDVAETGVAGCSIEDYSGDPNHAIYEESLAIERIHAAVEAKNSLDREFVLTARCESYLWNQGNFEPVVRRLQAFEKAGADVLFAPGMDDLSDIEQLVRSINIPLNVVVSNPELTFGLSDLKRVGVRRISLGSSMAQLAYGAVIDAIREFAECGSLDFTAKAIDWQTLESFFD